MICGDLVQKANDQSFADFNRIKTGFKIPCYCAAGNHDVKNVPTAESLKRYREKVGGGGLVRSEAPGQGAGFGRFCGYARY